MLNFYDFEVFQNDWLVVIINPYEESVVEIVNNTEQLQDYYNKHKNEIWVGYNSRNYDQWILKGILCGFNPKEINDFIIDENKKGWEYSSLLMKIQLNNFDIMTRFVGLKQLEGFMGNDIRETTVPFDIKRKLTDDEIKQTLFYCRHDVEQTMEVFARRKVEFDSHISLIKTFNLPLSAINKSQAQLASTILKASKGYNKNDDEWNVRMPNNLILKKYKKVADWFIDEKNHSKDCALEINIADVPHIFAWGGVHGAISKFIYECKNDEYLIMADVSQLYPFLMLNYELLSRNCNKKSYSILKDTVEKSIILKQQGKKKEREPYKRFNNIIYGSMGDKTNNLYDANHRLLVCVFGQVLILDLIEKIEGFSKLIQSNTDGILILIKKKYFEKLDDVVAEWEERTGLSMTFDFYKKVIQKDVNNYVVIDYNGKCKTKGAYVKELNDLDYDLPIVNEAMINFFTKNQSIKKTIYECKDFKKFQKIIKLSSKYKYAWHNNKKLTDRTFRVFASLEQNDGYIGKQKEDYATIEKFANTPQRCFIYNENVNDVEIQKQLDKDWYIQLTIDRLIQFGVDRCDIF